MLRKIKKITLDLKNNLVYRNNINKMYSGKFFRKNIELSAYSANILINLLMEKYNPNSVLDIGCGNGIYLKEFQNNNVDILGVDGSANAKKTALISPELILLKDLREPFFINSKFDLTLCIEVAEHIDEEYVDTFINNICNYSNRIIFTAAPPGQGGTHHVNEQPCEYWIKKFARYNYILDTNETELTSRELEAQNGVFWLYKNLMIFKKRF
ncbi:bifunctional 2-polyprenyl-6-hydroxyphenol methylase/3-demethylubiquinol 3-O-methyltransferase UbiG [Methanococcoides methylutens]|uniref:Methyltransferase domain-containing protein n=1 Tax=Methanococcoides methylutens MM1 TaxID=1434104 RepID=A0A0E3SSI1_METMT|nr:class I SAM-dependent methyltransferase [Methanococcoides methylutens]AKB86161.1 hypothetical protein MCMEM_2108 [Methanococcoides methylutens MM1]